MAALLDNSKIDKAFEDAHIFYRRISWMSALDADVIKTYVELNNMGWVLSRCRV